MSRPTRMMFGKWKGRALTELPASYIRWLANLPDLREPLRGAVWAEIRRRHAAGKWSNAVAPKPRPAAPQPTRPVVRTDADGRRWVGRLPVETLPEFCARVEAEHAGQPAAAPQPAPDGLARVVEVETAAAESAATADEWADVMAAAGKAVGRA